MGRLRTGLLVVLVVVVAGLRRRDVRVALVDDQVHGQFAFQARDVTMSEIIAQFVDLQARENDGMAERGNRRERR